MRVLVAVGLALAAISVAACGQTQSTVAQGGPSQTSGATISRAQSTQTPTPTATATSAPAPAPAQDLTDFRLYTHCGIYETRIGDDFYVATRPLDDGNGNPPRVWGNPFQAGEMRVYPNGTATFTAGSLQAEFAKRPNATDWIRKGCD